MKHFNAEEEWLYHADKDNLLGSYEWWYLDAHLDDGYLVTIAFAIPSILNSKYNKYMENVSRLFPAPPYNPLNYAQVKVTVVDTKGITVFISEEDVKPENIFLPSLNNMIVKLNNCQLKVSGNDGSKVFTVDIDIKDGKGNTAKGNLVFNSLVPPMVPGRGRPLDAVIEGTHLYHSWYVFASTAKVKANITITGDAYADGLTINEGGFGYHDKNWGNHAARATSKGWIWARIAEADLTVVFCESETIFGNLIYPTYRPCIIVHDGRLLTNTEALDYSKGPAAAGRLAYPTESIITFKPESGINGTIRFHDLQMLFEMGPYSRLSARWAMNIESKYGRLRRDGNLLFEFCDIAVPMN